MMDRRVLYALLHEKVPFIFAENAIESSIWILYSKTDLYFPFLCIVTNKILYFLVF